MVYENQAKNRHMEHIWVLGQNVGPTISKMLQKNVKILQKCVKTSQNTQNLSCDKCTKYLSKMK